jgi:septal ring factor EnvC (AmiA/AmiB activator)
METETPVTEVKKKSRIDGMSILLIILLLAVVGLGIWGFVMNSNLKATQTDQVALQNKFDSLTSETNTLTTDLEKAGADLEKAKADLEKAKKDLSTAQADLTKSQDAIVASKADIEKALKYLDVAVGLFVDKAGGDAMKIRINAINDSNLTEKFDKYYKSGSETDFSAWLGYLFQTVADLLD